MAAKKHAGGRPTKLTAALKSIAVLYINECKDTVEHFEGESGKQWETWRIKLPTVAGLARTMKVARSTVYKWADEDAEFSDIVEDLLAEQDDRLVNQGLSGAYNPTIAKLLLSSKHGYIEKSAQEHTGAGGGPIIYDIMGNPMNGDSSSNGNSTNL